MKWATRVSAKSFICALTLITVSSGNGSETRRLLRDVYHKSRTVSSDNFAGFQTMILIPISIVIIVYKQPAPTIIGQHRPEIRVEHIIDIDLTVKHNL